MAVKGLLTSMVAVVIVATHVSYGRVIAPIDLIFADVHSISFERMNGLNYFGRQSKTAYRPSGYIGCFMNRQHAILSKKLTNLRTNSGNECMRRCHGYRYFGTEVSVKCFCGNCLHRPISAAKTGCNFTCPGSKTLEYCGGNWRLSLYDNLPSAKDIVYCSSSTARPSVLSVSSQTHKPTTVSTILGSTTATTISTARIHALTSTKTWSNTLLTTTLHASKATDTWSKTVSTLNASTATDTWSKTLSTLNGSTATDKLSKTVSTLNASTATDTWSKTVSTLNVSTATDTWSKTVSTLNITATDTWSNTLPTLNGLTATDTLSKTVSTLNGLTATDTLSKTVSTLNGLTATDTLSKTVSTLNGLTATDTLSKTVSTLNAPTATDAGSNTESTTTLHASTVPDTLSNTVPTTTVHASTATDTKPNTTSTSRFSAKKTTDTWPDTVSSDTRVTEAKTYNTESSFITSEWITVNNTQFHVVETKMNFSNALEHCRIMKAQLISYTNPLRYFVLSGSIGLKNNSYWIGVYGDNLVNECPNLVKNGTNSRIRLEKCSYTNSFICSRTADVSKAAVDHDFTELLKDMTIDVKNTNKAKRKLISAEDKRRSATFVGGAGIIVLCIFVAFVIFTDINWTKCQCVTKSKHI